MKHNEIKTGMLRAYLDGEVNDDRVSALTEHVGMCAECQAELKVLSGHAASVRAGLDYLPQPATPGVAPAWSAMRLRLSQPAANAPTRWSPWRAPAALSPSFRATEACLYSNWPRWPA